jgi:hypothetical protein
MESHPKWEKQPGYSFRARWVSRVDERRHYAERLALERLAKGRKVPLLLHLELDDGVPTSRLEGWHHFMSVGTFRMLDSFPALLREMKTFLKRDEFAAGLFESLFRGADAPVRLSKAQRVRLLDRALAALAAYPFADDDEHHFWEWLEPFGDYALVLSVEYAVFRRFMDGSFADDDNPLRSLVGQACRVTALAFDAEDGAKPAPLAEGELSLEGSTVRVGSWEHTFAGDDQVFESVAYEEVNIASEESQTSFYFTPLSEGGAAESEHDDA